MSSHQVPKGNPLRKLAKKGQILDMTSRGLVLDGIYHVDTLLRPMIETNSDRTRDPQLQQINIRVVGLKIPNLRAPKSTGWISPPTTGE